MGTLGGVVTSLCLTSCWLSPQEMGSFLQLSEWQSSSAMTVLYQHSTGCLEQPEPPSFLHLFGGKVQQLKTAVRTKPEVRQPISVLLTLSWLWLPGFSVFFFKPRLKDIIRHRNLVFTILSKTPSFIFINLVNTLRCFICWWAFKSCRKARWCPGSLWLYSSALLKALFSAILKDETCKESSYLLNFLICGKIQGHFHPWLVYINPSKDLYKASCQMFQ